MGDGATDDIEARALEVLRSRDRPRRRARPRIARPLAEAEELSLPYAGGEVAAWRLGTGPAVMFVHGWEDDNALWAPAIDLFTRWGRPVVALDLPGHGFSTVEDASITSVGGAVKAVADALGPVTALVGHSYGCAAIVHALGHGLGVDKAVLIASPVPRTRPRKPLEVEGVEPEVLARAEELRQDHAVTQTARIEATLRAMTIPALVIHSIDDEQTPLSNSQRLAELWPGAQLFLADGLGHRFVAQDDDVLQAVVQFVEGA